MEYPVKLSSNLIYIKLKTLYLKDNKTQKKQQAYLHLDIVNLTRINIWKQIIMEKNE